MNPSGRTILVIIIVAVFVGLAVVEFVSMKNGNQSPIRQAVRGMLDAPEPAPEPAPETPPDPAQKREPAPKDKRPAAGSSSSSFPRLPVDATASVPGKPSVPVIVVPRPQPPLSNVAPVFAVQQRRSDTFVPGNLRGWIGYGVTFDQPLLVRAGGELRAGDQISGPDGLAAAAAMCATAMATATATDGPCPTRASA